MSSGALIRLRSDISGRCCREGASRYTHAGRRSGAGALRRRSQRGKCRELQSVRTATTRRRVRFSVSRCAAEYSPGGKHHRVCKLSCLAPLRALPTRRFRGCIRPKRCRATVICRGEQVVELCCAQAAHTQLCVQSLPPSGSAVVEGLLLLGEGRSAGGEVGAEPKAATRRPWREERGREQRRSHQAEQRHFWTVLS